MNPSKLYYADRRINTCNQCRDVIRWEIKQLGFLRQTTTFSGLAAPIQTYNRIIYNRIFERGENDFRANFYGLMVIGWNIWQFSIRQWRRTSKWHTRPFCKIIAQSIRIFYQFHYAFQLDFPVWGLARASTLQIIFEQ